MSYKLSIFILLFILFSSSSFAQKYYPLPDKNVVWQQAVYISYPDCNNYNLIIYYVSGDTIISGYQYSKVYSEGKTHEYCQGGYLDSSTFAHVYNGAFRQDSLNKKVYIVWRDTSVEQLLYDFNLSVGDTIKYIFPDDGGPNAFGTPVVDSIDSVLIDGSFHRRFLYVFPSPTSDGSYPDALIEGIGNTRGFLLGRAYYDGNNYNDVNCVTVNGRKIFGSDSICLSPGFTSGIPILINNEIASLQINENNSTFLFQVNNPSNSTLTLEVVNMLGQVCYKKEVQGSSIISISSQNLSDGMLIGALTSEQGIESHVKFLNF